ncbi:MAG TPA: FlgD immunoglobulin-like domain containing protein [Candidatus Eisenbacteria bacterium]|nr:FlgD immunoglobulin-like domain containing protein [Candidatus Eisenbacteria bacterium]
MKVLLFALPLVLALGPAPGTAAESFRYQLGQESSNWAGCLPPCQCPAVTQDAMLGTFELEPQGFDGTFQHYRVTAVMFDFISDDTYPADLVGGGSYKVSGDQQQLVLDLSCPICLSIERFDSGLTGGGASFPNIKLPVARNGFYCNDHVLGIDAKPASTTDVPPDPHAPIFSLRLGPNPFRGSANVVFTLPKDGAVDLRVHDLAGRQVKALATGRFTSGPHSVAWDGRDSRGSRVSAGVYFVRLKAAERESKATIVKLD